MTPTMEQVERAAIALWQDEAARGGTDSIARQRTAETWPAVGEDYQARWRRTARTALSAAGMTQDTGEAGAHELSAEAVESLAAHVEEEAAAVEARAPATGDLARAFAARARLLREAAKALRVASPAPAPAPDATREAVVQAALAWKEEQAPHLSPPSAPYEPFPTWERAVAKRAAEERLRAALSALAGEDGA